MRLSLIDDSAAVEPLTLDEAKQQLKLPIGRTHPEDSLIADQLIPAARDRAELATRRALRITTWTLSMDQWANGATWNSNDWLELPRPPLIEVTGLTYTDDQGVLRTLASDQYIVDVPLGPRARRGRVAPAYGVTWPSARSQMNTVTLTFVAGYSALPVPVYGQALPPLLKQGLLIDLATLYAHRESVVVGTSVVEVPDSAKSIYRSYKSYGDQRWVDDA